MEPCSGSLVACLTKCYNVNTGFSGNMATVMVVAPAWHLLAKCKYVRYHNIILCCTTILGVSSTSEGKELQIP